MRYVKNRSHFSKKKSPKKTRWVLLLLFVFIVAVAIVVASLSGKEVEEVVELLSDEVGEEQDSHTEEPLGDEGFISWTQEIMLDALENNTATAVARRGVDDIFTHVIVADLPVIDATTHFYEGWLVKPGVVEFFSTGEFFPREDGKWGLVWEVPLDQARDDLLDYREVVITREVRDGNAAPSPHHVLEGAFVEP